MNDSEMIFSIIIWLVIIASLIYLLIRKIIKEEFASMSEESEVPTMSGSESANTLRTAIANFVAGNPQLADPKTTVMAIVNEVIK